ncbi:MAG TPA: barstar family protein, partial [Roseiflexaceae bacterium]|nr:barstar family protein [Roseiflexaceae bacterium]
MNDALLERVFALPAGVYRWPARLSRARLEQQADAKQWSVAVVEGRGIHTKRDFLARCAEALHFPNYFGYNWDAFEECLNGIPAEPGFLLLLSNLRSFAEDAPDDWHMARDILVASAVRWGARGVPFVVLVRGIPAHEALARHS